MPSRTFFDPPDFRHVEEILRDYHGSEAARQFGRFRRRGIAPLLDAGSLPHVIGISPKIIYSITSKPEKHYRTFYIPREGRGPRKIDAPRTYLKVVQWWIYDNILRKLRTPNYVKGFVRGQSCLTNARYHHGGKHILNVDIKDFFPSISADKVRQCWIRLGYSSEVSEQLTEICTYQGGLPQGAPTSPSLANLSVRTLDKELNSLARAHGFKFSRYADDITFSSRSKIPEIFVRSVATLVQQDELRLNNRKTRFQGPGGRMEVTGYVINEKIQPSRTWRNRARAIFFQARTEPAIFADRINELHGYVGVIRAYVGDVESRLLSAGLGAVEAVKAYRRNAQHG